MSRMNVCPAGCDLQGDPIPEESRGWYGGKTHYSLMLGMEIPEVYDGVLIWYCPKCGMYWPRFAAPDRRHTAAVELIERWQRERDGE